MATADVQEVAVRWGGAPGQGFFVNVLHVVPETLGVFDQAYVDDLATALGDAFTASDYIGDVSDDVFIDKITVKDHRVEPFPVLEGSVFVGGGASGTVMPAESAIVTTLRTALGGRSGRGRIYNAGLTIASVNSTGDVVANTALHATAFWQAVQTSWLGLDNAAQLAVYSRKLNEANLVTGMFSDAKWDTQRKRGE